MSESNGEQKVAKSKDKNKGKGKGKGKTDSEGTAVTEAKVTGTGTGAGSGTGTGADAGTVRSRCSEQPRAGSSPLRKPGLSLHRLSSLALLLGHR
mmetsp:Transcript_17589/g.38992  ORF Transcript_17589/g.38992 Transcript_17589/m.38992 type:complete len:95 (-) Transcript_17589:627-911(-)